MITKKNSFLPFFAVLILTFSGIAQDKDSISFSKNEIKITQAKDIPLDTSAVEIKGVDQVKSSQILEDNPLTLIRNDDKSAYNLQDNLEAAKYDSLWMKELYESAALSDEMYEDISTIDPEKPYSIELNTDTLKMRLELLNQKTPFNVVYNPSLENVIKSFLTHKRGLMNRMLTVSQFYFPLFEQEFLSS